jgi:hypothetical protein
VAVAEPSSQQPGAQQAPASVFAIFMGSVGMSVVLDQEKLMCQ